MDTRVTIENWTHTAYEQNTLKALISLGADERSLTHDEFLYMVTVVDVDHHELFQQEFSTLPEACWFLNQRYRDWNFIDYTNLKTDGCSSCAAH